MTKRRPVDVTARRDELSNVSLECVDVCTRKISFAALATSLGRELTGHSSFANTNRIGRGDGLKPCALTLNALLQGKS